MKSGVEGSLERRSEIGSLFSPSSFSSCPNSIPACQFFVSCVEFSPASTPCLNSAELVSTCCFMPSLIHSSFSLKIMSHEKLLNLLAARSSTSNNSRCSTRRDLYQAGEFILNVASNGIESVQLLDCCAT